MYWNTENMFSNLLKKATKNIKLTVYSDHQNVNFFAHAIITDTNNLQVVHVVLCFYLTIRLQARVFYEQIVNEAQPSWLSLVENEGE